MKPLYPYANNIPLISLLLSNMVSLLGVLFLGWDGFTVVIIYWSENIVVGFYSVIKMAMAQKPGEPDDADKFTGLIFFTLAYGAFTFAHGFVIMFIFYGMAGWELLFRNGPTSINILFAFTVMLISHGISFYHHYLRKKEYVIKSMGDLVLMPFIRIFVMQLAVILGATVADYLQSPVWFLLILVAIKTRLDVHFHLREHDKTKK